MTSVLLYPRLARVLPTSGAVGLHNRKYGSRVERGRVRSSEVTGSDAAASVRLIRAGQYRHSNPRMSGRPTFLSNPAAVGSNRYFYIDPQQTLEYTQPFCYNMIVVNDAERRSLIALLERPIALRRRLRRRHRGYLGLRSSITIASMLMPDRRSVDQD